MSPDQQFVLALVAALVPLVVAIGGIFFQIRQLKLHVNSRMDQLLEVTRKSTRAEAELAAAGRQRRHGDRAPS